MHGAGDVKAAPSRLSSQVDQYGCVTFDREVKMANCNVTRGTSVNMNRFASAVNGQPL